LGPIATVTTTITIVIFTTFVLGSSIGCVVRDSQSCAR
jgi:hypothetical protein